MMRSSTYNSKKSVCTAALFCAGNVTVAAINCDLQTHSTAQSQDWWTLVVDQFDKTKFDKTKFEEFFEGKDEAVKKATVNQTNQDVQFIPLNNHHADTYLVFF